MAEMKNVTTNFQPKDTNLYTFVKCEKAAKTWKFTDMS